ncbi:retrovirus-related pol polyprotein from transposon TNT 1-94 [Tanacetum coccineum]
MQQPMPNPEDIIDPTTAMNMALVLIAKAFKLNYSTPTNNNRRISSNPRNRQIAQPGMNMGQDRQTQMVGGNGGNKFRQYAGQNVGNQNRYNVVQNVRNQVVQNAVQNSGVQNVGNQNGLIVVSGIANQNPNGNGNVVAARAEGNAIGNNGNQIRCYNYRGLGHLARNCTVRPRRRDAAYLQTQLLIAQKEEAEIQLQAEEFDLMAAAADLDEIEKVNANCILMANLQQASTSGTQTDKAPVYDSDGPAEVHNYDNCYDNEIFNMFTQEEQYTELLEPIPKPHQVQQNDSNVISEVSSLEQDRGTVDQHPTTVEETRAYFESLYNNLAIEFEKVNTVNRKLRETNADLTTKLARYKNQEKCFEISQEKYDKLESSGKQITTLNEEISNLNNQLSKEKSTVSSLLEEKKKLKSDFKIREDELLDKQIQLENKIKELDNILVKTGQSIQTMHMLSPKPDSFYHTEQKMALGYQNPFYLKQAQQKQQSLYNGKVLLEKHDPPAVYDSEETLQLAQESRLKMKQLNKEIKPTNYTKINHLSGVFVSQTAKSREELYFSNTFKTANVSKPISIPNEEFSDDTTPSVARKFLNEVKSTIVTLQQAAKFVRDFKSLAKEANESLAKHKALELEIECLLRAVVSQDIMSIVQNTSVVDTSNLQTELDRTKERFENCIIKKENEYAKVWNDWYKKCEECKYDKISYDKAYNDMQQKIERLQAQLGDLKGKCEDTPGVSDTLDPLSQKLKNENVELKFQVSEQKDITKVNITAKTRRPQPRSNAKNDRVPSESMSSCIKNKEVEVEEHHRKLLLSKNKKHMSSECNNVKLAIRNDKSEFVCAMCKQCLITANHDVCVLNYVNGMNSRGKKQKANVSNIKNQKKQKPKVKKPEKVGSQERLASPKPSKPIICLRWSPTGRIFDIKGKIIATSKFECQSDCSNDDNACMSNPQEPTIKRFPNSTSFLGRSLKLLINFVWKFLGTVRFGNDHIAAILGKSKRESHPPKPVPKSKQRLHLLHMDLCGPMRIASINGKRYVLVIVDDYSCYTWVLFLRSKDEALEEIKTFLKKITVLLQALVIIVRTDNGTDFKYQVLQEYFNSVGISYQVSSVRTPQQNEVVERRNRMLVEAARTMLIFSRAPLFLWDEAIATACYTQNCPIIHRRSDKTPYELINGRKSDIPFLHVFRLSVIPRMIMKILGSLVQKLSAMAFEQSSSKPGLQGMTSGQISSRLDLTYAPSTITTQQPNEGELDLLFEDMYDDYIGGQLSAAPRIVPAAQAPQVLQTLMKRLLEQC